MGIDGIAVERSFKQAGHEANLDVAAAEFTSLVRSAQKAGTDTGLGALHELVISLEGRDPAGTLVRQGNICRTCNKSRGNLGRARFELRKAELQIAGEFAM